MKFSEWTKSLTNILKTDDLHKYNGEDLKALIIAGSTGDALAAKPVVIKTVQNIIHLQTVIFWDKMERFLYGSFHNLEDQVKMASRFEFDTENYARFVKKQISIINQIEDDEKVDFFAMLTRAFLLGCIQSQDLYFKLAKFLMLCTYDELEFLQKCDYNFASANTAMISGLYQFGLFAQSSDGKGNVRYVLTDFAKALKQNSLNFYQELHGEKRIGSYEEMQPLALLEPLSVDDIDKLFTDNQVILNSGTSSDVRSAVKQGISLPAAQHMADKKAEIEVSHFDHEIAQKLADI